MKIGLISLIDTEKESLLKDMKEKVTRIPKANLIHATCNGPE